MVVESPTNHFQAERTSATTHRRLARISTGVTSSRGIHAGSHALCWLLISNSTWNKTLMLTTGSYGWPTAQGHRTGRDDSNDDAASEREGARTGAMLADAYRATGTRVLYWNCYQNTYTYLPSILPASGAATRSGVDVDEEPSSTRTDSFAGSTSSRFTCLKVLTKWFFPLRRSWPNNTSRSFTSVTSNLRAYVTLCKIAIVTSLVRTIFCKKLTSRLRFFQQDACRTNLLIGAGHA